MATLSGLLTGTGTQDDPHLIYTAEDLNLVGLFPCDFNKHFKLMADIDLSAYAGASFNIIGEVEVYPFRGVFDGNGHTISNFSYSGTKTAGVGLFGYVSGSDAEIKNLGLIDPNIDVPTAGGVGVLAGCVRWRGSITNCYVQGGNISGYSHVGGLVGGNEDGAITDCYAAISVFGKRTVGGLVGHNDQEEDGGSIRKCYAACNVTCVDNSTDVGGLVGRNSLSTTIKDCYATGSVTAGTSSDSVGGLVGTNWGTIANCYAAVSISAGNLSVNVGGLVGLHHRGYVIRCYWDVETSGQTISADGEGKTTAEMRTASTFVGWGCEPTVWTVDEGVDYPKLAWEHKPGDALPAVSEFLTGSGTQADPYLIYTADEFNMVGLFPCGWSKHFRLMADIDLSSYTGTDFNIIGYYISDNDNKPFTGIFDGNGKRISNFSYTSTDTDDVGVFGYFEGVIKDLGLINPNVDAGEGQFVGSLVGCIEEDGTITGCYAQGGRVSGDYYVGGLVGWNIEGTITDSYATGSVLGRWGVGGLVGYNGFSATVTNCYSTGSVMGTTNVGGLIGVLGNDAVVTNSFWDTETSGQIISDGGDGKTTAEMQTVSTFIGWGCEPTVWTIDEGVDYPRLAWEDKPWGALPTLSEFLTGSGTQADPYLVYTADALNMIGLFPCGWSKHFKLMADIDLSVSRGTDFKMIGNRAFPFTGIFDGNGHTISNLNCTKGLFRYVSGENVEIRDLGLIEPTVDAGTGMYAGLLVGYLSDGTITNCYAEGGSILGDVYVGGLVGSNSGTITGCYSRGGTTSGHSRVGGLVGANSGYGTIINCYVTTSVSGDSYVGGLVGINWAMMSHCYFSGSVWIHDYGIGGLVGENAWYGTVTSSFWDSQISGVNNMCGNQGRYAIGCDDSYGKTTAEMQTASIFLEAGWDFVDETANGTEDIWWILEGQDYPRLWWEGLE